MLELYNSVLTGGPVVRIRAAQDIYGNCDQYTSGIIDGQGLYVTRNKDTYCTAFVLNNVPLTTGSVGWYTTRLMG